MQADETSGHEASVWTRLLKPELVSCELQRHLAVAISDETVKLRGNYWQLSVRRSQHWDPGQRLHVTLMDVQADRDLAELARLGLVSTRIELGHGTHAIGTGPFEAGPERNLKAKNEPSLDCVISIAGDGAELAFPSGARLHLTWGRDVRPELQLAQALSDQMFIAMAMMYQSIEAYPVKSTPWEEALFIQAGDLAPWKNLGVEFGAVEAKRKNVAHVSPHVSRQHAIAQSRSVEQQPSEAFKSLATARRSSRAFGRQPAASQMILNHLNAVYAYRSVWTNPWGQTVGRKAIPSAGGLHPLEVYLVHTTDLKTAIFQYDAHAQTLNETVGLDEPAEKAARSISVLCQSVTGAKHRPSAVILLAVDAEHAQDKYKSIFYHNALKDVGAFTAALQYSLADTEIKSCPIGAVPSTLASKAINDETRRMVFLGAVAIGLPDSDSTRSSGE